MRNSRNFILSLFFLIILFTSCEKKEELSGPNQPPIARAGKDTVLEFGSCSEKFRTLKLDGGDSFDPEGKIARYLWRVLDPQTGFILKYADTQNPILEFAEPGIYQIGLTVSDNRGLASMDTILVTVLPYIPKILTIDFAINAQFTHWDNFEDCYGDFGCIYYDLTKLKGYDYEEGFGSITIDVTEIADTTSAHLWHDTYIDIKADENMNFNFGGYATLNIDSLIEKGGGDFSCTMNLSYTNWQPCEPGVPFDIKPLIISGHLDITTKFVNLKITGQVYF